MTHITKRRLFGLIAAGFFASSLFAQDLPITPAPAGVGTTFTVIFGLTGMGVAPAGTDNPKAGHHHLLVDQTELPEAGKPMGNPPLHFGGGQTETTLTLEPGTHTLQLILGDHIHVPHNPPIVSELITIEVK